MNRFIRFEIFTIIFTLLFGTNISAQDKSRQLDDFFSVLVKNQGFDGSVLIAERGRVVYERSFGYADYPNRRLNTKETLFPIASIAKTITSTAILQQVEKGNLRLDDPAAKYLPDFPYPQITVKSLLSHTSGLPPYSAFFDSVKASNPHRIFTNADFVQGLSADRKPLTYQPGESWNYDNTNYIVLALILEKVSGESYEEYIENHILQPAGMRHTDVFPFLFDSSRNNIRNLAIPHWYPQMYADEPIRSDSIPYISSYWKAYQFEGFSNLNSTTHDLLKYDQALYDRKFVNEQLLHEAFTPVKLNDGKVNPGNYGLGWTVAKDDSLGKVVYHSGGAIGLSCILYRNVTKNQTVIAFDITRPNAHYIAVNVLRILNGAQAAYPKKNLTRFYGKLLVTKGSEIAAKTAAKLRKDIATYDLDKEELIKLGYEFMGDVNPFHLPVKPRYAEAIEVFKLCVRLFPDYWNSYDSYGDALARIGKKEMAIEMYRKSIELNPKNESGKRTLQKLQEEINR